VLAAGVGSRMGRPKQLLMLHGETLVHRAARTAIEAGLDDVVVVIGQAADEVERALSFLPVRIVRNTRYLEGMSTSLRSGLEGLGRDWRAVVVMLGDQPLLSPEIVRSIAAAYVSSAAPLVVPVFAGRRGNPVLFDRSLLPELLAVEGDAGARDVVWRHALEAVEVPFEDAQAQFDLDTPDDYEAARRMFGDDGA
jgi:molybdenum cofactor cytidylyltransferase